MRRARAPEAAATLPVVPKIYINMYEAEQKSEEEADAFSCSAQEDPNPCQDEDEGTGYIEASDWLMEATVDLSQDLETSKKELDIIRLILQEMEHQSQINRRLTRLAREDRFKIMKACREYSSSRCDLLRERLGQVQFWAHARMLGQQVPGKAPDEWHLTDVEWRRWLSEQAGKDADQLGGSARASSLEHCVNNTPDLSSDVAWRVWGTLPYILSADTWCI